MPHKVTYSRDNLDTLLDEAASADTGRIKIRIQPAILKDSQYLGWPGVSWIIETADPQEAIEFRELLNMFLAAWGRYDAATIRQALEF